jgi:hypothetical protein
LSEAARSAVTMREKRTGERRRSDRRRVNLGSPTRAERRKIDRRTGRDRRNRV